jgi:RNA polymerase sigma factor (sigma-70 family)
MASEPVRGEDSPDETADGQVIAASLTEPERFGRIFERHFDAIHRYAARRVGTALADDLTAHTFTVAFERRHSFDAASDTARPWLYGIATNLIRNHHRTERRLLATLSRLGHDIAGVSAGADRSAERGPVDPHLAKALRRLRPEQRDVLLLHCWADLTHTEIASALGIAPGTVASRLSRARHRIRAAIEARPSPAPDLEPSSDPFLKEHR